MFSVNLVTMVAEQFKFQWLCAIILISFVSLSNPMSVSEGTTKVEGIAEARSLFSPRVDYNEWMPVGRGDPLKNDPTYDYSPPVLDRVRYWGDNTKEKSEILLLGVPSKRQSSFKKESNKYGNSVSRRNYYPNLPTRLMPPPMQTISPITMPTTTESYQSSLYPTSNVYNYHAHPYSPYSPVKPSEPHTDESINFVSLSLSSGNSISGGQVGPTIIKFPEADHDQYDSKRRKPWIHTLLEKEIEKPTTTNFVMEPSKNIFESHSFVEPIEHVEQDFTQFTTTTETPTYFQPTIPPTTMTTDALFSHYKQPTQPIRGPMYLIIEGHSKVKTYGLKTNSSGYHEPNIVPVQPRGTTEKPRVVNQDDEGYPLQVKHLHQRSKDIEKMEEPADSTAKDTSDGMDSLLTLLDTSLSSFFVDKNEQPNAKLSNTDKSAEDRNGRQIADYDQLPEEDFMEMTESEIVTTQPNSDLVTPSTDES